MRRRRFIKLGSQLLCSSLLLPDTISARMSTPFGKKKPTPPNVVLLLADDLRSDALGFMGNQIIQTPNLDGLARNSTVFDNCFVTTSICPTSRVSILTGRYASNHNIWDFKSGINDNLWSKSLPNLFQNNGYHIGFIGKWGLGGQLPKSKYNFFRGFAGQGRYFEDGKHMQDRLYKSSLDFFETRPNQPFFLQISFKTPHVQDGDPEPFQAPKNFSQLYNDWSPERMPTDQPGYFKLLPKALQSGEGYKRYRKRYATDRQFTHNMQQYYRLISGLDDTIGKVIQILKEKNILENTIIVFTSDNGLLTGEYGLAGKWWMFEGSIRVPLMIFIPSKIPQRDSRLALNIDISPTLQELCGLSKNNTQGLQLFDKYHYYDREAFFYEHRFQTEDVKILPSSGIRTKNHKYIKFKDLGSEHEMLFNIVLDQHEKYNLVNSPEYFPILSKMRNLHDKLASNIANDFE